MCGRYYFDLESSYEEFIKLQISMDLFADLEFATHEVFPSQNALLLIAQGDQLIPRVMKWGITSAKRKCLINARGETITSRPTFRKMLDQRCVVLANGFYEWKENGKHKDKIYIQNEDHSLMYLAGIYNEQNEFVIVTAESKNDMAKVHDRTPIIYHRDEMKQYLRMGLPYVEDNRNLIFENISHHERSNIQASFDLF